MDKLNNYNSSQQVPSYNSPNNQVQNYQSDPISTFTKVDSSTLINPQSNLNFNQRQSAPNLSNQPYNGSQFLQQSLQSQPTGNQAVINGSGRSRQTYKNKYSFKRNTVQKSSVFNEVRTENIQQPATIQINEGKLPNTNFVFQRQQKAQNLSTNTLNQFPNQQNTIFTPRPSSNIINNIQSPYIPTPINILIPPSPARPSIVTPSPNKPIMIPSQQIIVPIQPQPWPNMRPSQPQPGIRPLQPQPIVIPSQPQPFTTPLQPQPVIIQFVPPKPVIVNPQPLPVVTPPIIPEFVDKSQQYIKQIRELRTKVEQLQTQKLQLIDQVRYYERQRFQSNSQETLRVYKEQIQYLKQRIAQINVADNLSAPAFVTNDKQIQELREKLITSVNREKEYESQLIQAQNHIIYLQNISKSKPSVSHQNVDSEIQSLRQTIANYNEHVQQIELQKQDYRNYIISKEEQIKKLYEQNNALNTYLQQNKPSSPQNGIDPSQYYSLLAQFGKKDLQVIILMQEKNRLEKQSQDLRDYLEKAQDYILELQKGLGKVQVDLPQKESQNQENLKKSYENEVKRLTSTIAELSKQSTVYQAEAKKYKLEVQSLNVKINQLTQQITNYKTQINNYKMEIQKFTNINVQLAQQINVYKSEINNYTTQINQITKNKTTTEGVSSQTYNALIIDFGKKQLQVIILLQEINRLNTLKKDISGHLQQAEQFIFAAQEHIKSLESRVNTPLSASNTEIEGYKLKIKDLEGKLALATQKISTFENKESAHVKQVQGLQLKYKGIAAQHDKNYNQLLSQKNSLAQRIKTLSNANTKVSSANISSEALVELQQTNKRLSIQLAQVTEHLINAQSYIKLNSQKWQKSNLVEKQLAKTIDLVALLNNDITLLQVQILELNDRNINLQKTIQQITNSQANSQNTTIVTRQKEEKVLQSDRRAQIQQLQLSLNNYIALYNEAQTKLNLAQQQLSGYKEQIKKFAELQGYLKKTQEFITEQELKWNTQLKNYETENLQIKNHLMGAEIHIKAVEQRHAKLNTDYLKIQQQNKLHIMENHEINQALKRAEQHIYEMEKTLNIKKH